MDNNIEVQSSVILIEGEGSLGVVGDGRVRVRERVDQVKDIGSSKKRKRNDGDKVLESNGSQELDEEPLKVGSRGEIREEVLNKEEQQSILEVIQSLKDQVARLIEEASRSNSKILQEEDEALAPHVLSEEYPKGWRRPKLLLYNEKTDPEGHLHSFETSMEDVITKDDI